MKVPVEQFLEMSEEEKYKLFDSEEDKEEMRKEDARREEYNRITETITKNEDYIKWLESFMTDFTEISDTMRRHNMYNLTEEEINNVKKLGNFYEAVEMYAKSNYLFATQNEFGNHYYVSYNGNCYEIGVMRVQGTSFFARRLEETRQNAVEFEDIKYNVLSQRAIVIRTKLNALEDYVLKNASDISPDALQSSFDNILLRLERR